MSDDAVVLISGASGGIGGAIAEQLLEGYRLSLCGRSTPSSPQLREAIHTQQMHWMSFDGTEEHSAEKWVSAAANIYGRIDAVVNCLGDFVPWSFRDDLEELDRLIATNLKAPLRIIRAAYPHLIQAENPKIINLVSLSGLRVASPASAGYAMSKFALRALGQAVRHEGWDQGLRVTSLSPGWVDTKMAAGRARLEGHQMTQPADIAQIVRLLLTLPPTCSISEIAINCQPDSIFQS